ncbi:MULTISPECIES: hypothetical protein [Thalassospira]|uniref:Restriction endonuclease n=1 Tax=Thalassospira lohafexi TaxID=744227 RepID=A0A2N3L1B6_9PROT|nr:MULTISPECIES: hypothetical protein [Thalassospira]PKR56537.1 hypothetical protein COO92_20080 [Thalassospira lohafexi]|tara:strand:- start:1305 stop:2015 length:711 start_codon:yes stop_codon:yes gene_type:complete
MSRTPSMLQDHLSELIRGQELPLPALDHLHVEVILELLQNAYTGIKADYHAAVSSGEEKHLNSLMVDRLNHLVGENSLASLLVRSVSRGTETKNYDATRFEMRPDIQISLTSRQHLFPLIVECKLIHIAKGKTVDLYCRDGLARFTTGDYAWTNQEALMLAYVRDGVSTTSHLSPFLEAATRRSPPEYAVVSLPQKCAVSLPDAARSEHGRYFKYVHGGQGGKLPGDIAVWHLWVS